MQIMQLYRQAWALKSRHQQAFEPAFCIAIVLHIWRKSKGRQTDAWRWTKIVNGRFVDAEKNLTMKLISTRMSLEYKYVFLVCLLVGQIALIGRPGNAQEKIKDRELRILSYNIHHGEGVDKKLDLERIAKVIMSCKPDIVALQELDEKTGRTKQIDQPERLAKLTGMQVVFGANIKFGGGRYGNAVLTRYEITNSSNVKLPNLNSGEQRGLLMVELDRTPFGPLTFLATHFDHRRDGQERLLSARMINEKIKFDESRMYFLAGDFNDVVGSPPLNELEKHWTRSNDTILPTVPVGKPVRQIDFVFYHPDQRISCRATRVLPEAIASDHRAILAVFRIQNSAK